MRYAGLRLTGTSLNLKRVFSGIGICMIKIKRSWDRLIFTMRIPVPEKTILILRWPLVSCNTSLLIKDMAQSPRRRLVCLDDFRQEALKVLPPKIWDFLDSGSGNEDTLKQNRLAFNRSVLRVLLLFTGINFYTFDLFSCADVFWRNTNIYLNFKRSQGLDHLYCPWHEYWLMIDCTRLLGHFWPST